MIVLECNQTTFFDIDETVLIWDVPPGMEDQTIVFDNFGINVRLLPHFKHIEQMKRHKARGHTVICWSAGGWAWVKAVIETLKLEQYVDLIIEKPSWFYDDLPAREFMPEINRVYYDYKTLKQKNDTDVNKEDEGEI